MKINVLFLVPLVFAGFLVFGFVGMTYFGGEGLPSARQGQVAPEMTLTPLGDKPVFDAETLADGKVKLVNYWASWCAPCRAEHPNFTALAAEGVPIYGVNYKDSTANALGFLEELGDPYVAVGADVQGRTGLDWGLYGVPETYVIDGEGRIVLRFAGPVTQRVLAETIRPAMAEAGLN